VVVLAEDSHVAVVVSQRPGAALGHADGAAGGRQVVTSTADHVRRVGELVAREGGGGEDLALAGDVERRRAAEQYLVRRDRRGHPAGDLVAADDLVARAGQLFGQLEAVHSGHRRVADVDVEGRGRPGGLEVLQRAGTGSAGSREHPDQQQRERTDAGKQFPQGLLLFRGSTFWNKNPAGAAGP